MVVHIAAYSGYTEEELGSDASEDELLVGAGHRGKSYIPPRGWRLVLGSLGLVVIVLAAAVVLASLQPRASEGPGPGESSAAGAPPDGQAQVLGEPTSVRALLESPEFANTVAAQFMVFPHSGAAPPSVEVQSGVQLNLVELNAAIAQRYPDVSRHLDETQLSPGQRDALLRATSLVRNRDAQALGRDLTEASYTSSQYAAADGLQRKALETQVIDVLQSHADRIRLLGEQVVPDETMASPRFDNIRDMRIFKHLSSVQPQASRRLQSNPYTLGTHQQAQALLDLVPFFKRDFKTPDLSGLDEGLLTEVFKCVTEEWFSAMDFTATANCLSTFLAAATDALKTTLATLGLGDTT